MIYFFPLSLEFNDSRGCSILLSNHPDKPVRNPTTFFTRQQPTPFNKRYQNIF